MNRIGRFISDVWAGLWESELLLAVAAVMTIIAVISAIVFAVMGASTALIGPGSCRAATEGLRLPSRWSFWSGCQVHTRSVGWVPLENYYVTDEGGNA